MFGTSGADEYWKGLHPAVSVYNSLTRTERRGGSDLEGLKFPSRSKIRANLSLPHSFNKEEKSNQNETQESKIVLICYFSS